MENTKIVAHVRRACLEDLTVLDDFLSSNSDGYTISRASWLAYLCEKHYAVFVAYCQGTEEILGMSVVMISGEDIDIVYILTSKNHRLVGLGTLVLNHVISSLAPKKIYIDVSVLNLGAIEFYKKLGFKFFSTRKKYYGDVDAVCGVRNC